MMAESRFTDSSSRRAFVQSAGAAAAVAGTCSIARHASAAHRDDVVRVGLIGVGIRGYQLQAAIRKSKHARIVAISDLSEHYIERIRPRLEDPNTPVHRDYKALLDDQSIDAVVIASPDHWHAQMTLDALDAGKDVYVEKPMTYSRAEAVKVRDKVRSTKRVTQVGYQRRSMAHFHKAKEIVRSGVLGSIHHIQIWSSRNRPTPPWRAYNTYSTPGLPKKSAREDVDWDRFQANRPARPYDPRRFFHWQCYAEYSTGIFGILMSHPLDAANLLMGLDAPETCSATGGIYHYQDGRTVPDTCSALFNYPSRDLSIAFTGTSTNAYFHREAQYCGTEGTLELGPGWLRIYAERKNGLYQKYVSPDRAGRVKNLREDPVYEAPIEWVDGTLEHLDDFFTSVKDRSETVASVERCFPATIAMAMAVESYTSGRSVRSGGT